jgi:hypothetical protein
VIFLPALPVLKRGRAAFSGRLGDLLAFAGGFLSGSRCRTISARVLTDGDSFLGIQNGGGGAYSARPFSVRL